MLGLPPPDPQAPPPTPQAKTPEELKALLAQPQVGTPPPAPSPSPTPTSTAKSPEELKQLLAQPPPPDPLPHLNINLPGPVTAQGVQGAIAAGGRVVDATKRFATSVGIPMVTSTIGGALGEARGGYAGAVAGTMAGQALGDLVGATFELDPSNPESMARARAHFASIPENALLAGAGEGVFNPVMRGVSAATRFLFSPIQTTATAARQTMKPGMESASRFVEGQVMPHEVSTSPVLKVLGNIVEGAPATQAGYQKFLQDRRDLFVKKAEEAITVPGPRAERQEAGNVIKSTKIGQAASSLQDRVAATEARGQEAMDMAGAQAHSILQTGMTDAARFQADAEARRAAAQRAYDNAVADSFSTWGDLGDTIGPSMGRQPMGERTQALLTSAHEAARQEASNIYNRVWDATKNTKLTLDPLLERATALQQEIGAVPAATGVAGRANRAAGIVAESGSTAPSVPGTPIEQLSGRADVEAMVAKMDPADPRRIDLLNGLAATEAMLKGSADGTLTPQQVHSLKSYYGRMGFAEGGRSMEKGVFKQLYEAADKTLQQLPGEQYTTIRTADALHQKMVEDFEQGALEVAAKKEPQDILSMLQEQVKTGDAKGVQKLLEKIGPQGTQSVQAEFWHSLTHSANGTPLTPDEFLTQVKKLDPLAVKALFGGMADRLPTLQSQIERQTAAQAALGPAEKAAAGLEKAGTARSGEATKAADQLLVDTSKAATSATAKARQGADAALARLHALPTENLVAASLKKGDVEGAARLRELVGEEGWKKVQSVDLQRLFGRYEENPAVPLLSPKALSDNLSQRGEKAFVAAHSQTEWNQLQVFLRAYEKLAKAEPGGTGKIAIQLKSAAAATAVATGAGLYLAGSGDLTTLAGAAAAGGAILLGPKALAAIFQSPKMRNELIKGMLAKTRNDEPIALKAGRNLLRLLISEGDVQQSGAPGNQRVQTGDTSGGGRGAGPGPRIGGVSPGGRAGGPPPAFTPAGAGGRSGGAVPPNPPGTAPLSFLQETQQLPGSARIGGPPPPVKK